MQDQKGIIRMTAEAGAERALKRLFSPRQAR